MMKKLWQCLLFVFLFFCGTVFVLENGTFVQASSNAPYIKFGDVNSDGVINVLDTERIQRHIAADKSEEVYAKHPDWYLKGRAFQAADINADNKINSLDLLHVLRHIAMEKGENYISKIVTVTLMNEEKTVVYDCFPVIYYYSNASNSHYPYLYMPSQNGYSFKGWYLDIFPYGKVESYDALATANDHILCARWVKNKYKLSFDANGGSCYTPYCILNYGSAYGTLPTPTRKGYTFTGWYTKREGGSKVSSSTKMSSQDRTVYARWRANSYTLTFDSNGGSWKTKTKLLACGEIYGALPSPSRKGYTFTGWYTGRDYGSRVSYYTIMSSQNVTVYARWKANSYTVTFHSNDGNGKTETKTLTYGNTYGALPTPSRQGYTFIGWYTEKKNGSKVTASTKMSSQNVTVYARWKANSYTVTFDSNGGNWKTKTKKVTYDKTYGTLPQPSKSRYKFQGWYTKKNGGNKITDKTKVALTSNQRLYAHWKAATEVKLNKTSVNLRPKQTYQLKATVTGNKGSLKWASSNAKIVSVNSKGKITANKAGAANITVIVNGFKAVCKVTVANTSVSKVNYKSLRGKNYLYQNSKYTFGIGFAESTDYIYIGVWNLAGTSSSYEDFYFKVKEGTYSYRQKGMRSYYFYDITIKPYKDYVQISLKCQDSSYRYFDISNKNFKYTKNLPCSDYAEQRSTVEIKNYFHGAGPDTVYYTQLLADAIGGMKTGRNTKYPDLYCTGNSMVIGVNNHPIYNTSRNEYVRIENNGNTAVFLYGVKIGDTRKTMEEKFSKYNIRTWDNGKTYSNANAWQVHVTFKNGKLTKYILLCKPTS